MILIAILWFLGVLAWDIISDYKKWKKNIPVKHTNEMLIRAALLIPSAILLSWGDFSILKLLTATAMLGAWWWEFFDGIYNKLRGKSWRFNGSIDPDDSKLDTFLYHLSATKQALLKWGLIGLTTILYIIL